MCNVLYAQQVRRIELIAADAIEYDKSRVDAQILIGNVHLRNGDVDLFCDSAYSYKEENRLDAFGNVRIIQPGKLTITGGFLRYNGDNKSAFVERNVVLTDGSMQMKTPKLNYNFNSKIGNYDNGAVITDKGSTLKSSRGIYNSETKFFYFKGDVSVAHQDFDLFTDTLNYDSQNKYAYFQGLTEIFRKEGYARSNAGWFNTESQESFLNDRAKVESDSGRFIIADTIFYNQKLDFGYAIGNAWVKDTTEKSILMAGFIFIDKKNDKLRAYKNPTLVNYGEGDSLFLKADSIVVVKDTSGLNEIQCYEAVKIQQSDFALKCDTLFYREKDSIFEFYNEPVIWADDYQITGDYMEAFTANKEITRLENYTNSFIIRPIDTAKSDQIKGKALTVFFEEKKISSLVMKSNAETIYHVYDEEKYTGLNNIESSMIRIEFEEQKPKRMYFTTKPGGKLSPPKLINAEMQRLKDYVDLTPTKVELLETIKVEKPKLKQFEQKHLELMPTMPNPRVAVASSTEGNKN